MGRFIFENGNMICEKSITVSNKMHYISPMNQVIRNLISIRKKHRISQEELGEIFGIATSGVSKIESEQRKLEFTLVQKFADRVNMSLDEIVNYHKKEYTDQERKNDKINEPDSEYFSRIPDKETEYLKVQLKDAQSHIEDLKFLTKLLSGNLDKERETVTLLREQLQELSAKPKVKV